MYEAYFGLTRRPFTTAPSSDRYFPAREIEAARQTALRCVERAEGTCLVSGPSGVGKSLLLRVLAETLRRRFSVALLDDGRLTNRRDLLQAIAFQFGLPYRGLEEGELRLSLIDYLTAPERPAGMLLLVDEAHTLPIRVLEEIRLISNLVREGESRVRVVLAGGIALEERFASPRLTAFSQRLAARIYLGPLEPGDTRDYVRFQVRDAGGKPDALFSQDALETIHRATEGVPRLINQVCDHALLLAFAGGQRRIEAAGVQEAWADLQQLPPPWIESAQPETPKNVPGETVIEFGDLDDVSDDVPPGLARPLPVTIISGIDDDAPEPLERLDKVRAQLQEIDAEYTTVEPIGGFGEIDPIRSSHAPKALEPFPEKFEQEEMVLDRFAAFDAKFLAAQRKVESSEGRAISAMLEPCRPQVAPAPRLVIARVQEEEQTAEAPTAEDVLPQSPSETDSVPFVDLNAICEVVGLAAAPSVSESAMAPAAFQSRYTSYAHDEPPSGEAETDIMIVENDPIAAPAPKLSPAARPQEYGQLFARLRKL